MRPQPRLHALPLLAGLACTLGACTSSSRSELLRSELSATPPLGVVPLPARHDGVSFQGSLALRANGVATARLGSLEGGSSEGDRSDTTVLRAGTTLFQDRLALDGQASVFLSRHVRVLLGVAHTGTWWAGGGVSLGDPWSFEADLVAGPTRSRRRELWRIRSEDGYSTRTRDSTLAVRDSSTFVRLDLTFARRGGGPVLAYQHLSLPVTVAPVSGQEFTRSLRSGTLGWYEPLPVGTFGAFATLTSTGKEWLPSVRLQTSFDLGGDSP